MTDESTVEADTDVANADATNVATAEDAKERLNLTVDISDAGPCKKHLKVCVPRDDVKRFFDKEFSELVRSANVPGFRPGKTPRKLIERRFRNDVSSQVKSAILLKSLEQIAEEQKIEPLSEPNLRLEEIQLPDDDDFIYEFDVEVRPEFDLPEYRGLKIKRPVKEIGEKDIDEGLKTFLRRRGTQSPKNGPIAEGDQIVADVRILDGTNVVGEFEELQIAVEKELYFKDGKISGFSDRIVGTAVGDSRECRIVLSKNLTNEALRGKELDAVFVIKAVYSIELPEINKEFLDNFGCSDLAEFRDLLRATLERQVEFQQQQSARNQVLAKLLESADWELPNYLLKRQAINVLRRKAMELEQQGRTPDEVRAEINRMRQDVLAMTANSLKQQFILQKIAEVEKLEVTQEDLDLEIYGIARRTGESPRRIRARIEKEGLWDGVAIQCLERKTLDVILAAAEIEDVALEPEAAPSVSGVDASAVAENEELDETKPQVTESAP